MTRDIDNAPALRCGINSAAEPRISGLLPATVEHLVVVSVQSGS
jgi:hypothetical protein